MISGKRVETQIREAAPSNSSGCKLGLHPANLSSRASREQRMKLCEKKEKVPGMWKSARDPYIVADRSNQR
jgi:hypothetical protein